ncbi:unnamed protein product, partial [Brenthis ino]
MDSNERVNEIIAEETSASCEYEYYERMRNSEQTSNSESVEIMYGNMENDMYSDISRPSKRDRPVDEEEIWTNVTRRGKRMAREHRDIESTRITKDNIEVNITSKSSEKIPKQFKLAKILKAENIQDITKVKFISAYKVIIRFSNEDSADKLMESKYFQENGFKCQKTLDIKETFGVIKNIDLDSTEEEILESLRCEMDIIAVKRLKRRNSVNGQWEPSEVVRICFKGSSLPSKCNNCQGKHMALARTCPMYKKEKRIRELMAEFNCSYKRAQTIYVPPESIYLCNNTECSKEGDKEEEISSGHINKETDSCAIERETTYAEILKKPKKKERSQSKKPINSKKATDKDKAVQGESFDFFSESESENSQKIEEENARQDKNKISWMKILRQMQEKICDTILSETWLVPEHAFRINGYSIFRADRIDGYGGTAILTHKSIKATLCNLTSTNTEIQAVHVRLLNCAEIENIISIYCPSSVRTSKNDWDYFFSLFNHKTIIAGDFNGHHPNWSSKEDTRGNQIFDSILENNFITINDGTDTRIKLVNGVIQKTSPDLTSVSTDLAFKFKWEVINENLGSDHMLIKVSTEIECPRKYTKRRNYKKANWPSYMNKIESDLVNFTLPSDPQTAYNKFIGLVNMAADKYIPIIKVCENPLHQQKFKPKSYWEPNLSHTVAQRRLALAMFRRNPTPQNLDKLQNKISIAQRYIRRSSCKSFQEFCSKVDNVTNAVDMWAQMKDESRVTRSMMEVNVDGEVGGRPRIDYIRQDMKEKGVNEVMMNNRGEWKRKTYCADPK